jgi:hypothetical protein
MRVSSDLMMPSVFVIVLVFGLGFRARIVAVTLFGVTEKDVKRLFVREVVFRFVCVPDFGPASCGVFCHIKSIGEMGLKVKGLFLESRDFFADFSHRVEEDSRLIVHRGIQKILRDLVEFFVEFLDFFIFHIYTIAQDAEKARDFFTIA